MVQFNLGEGAFRTGKDYTHPQDIFKYDAALKSILKPTDAKPLPPADDRLLDSKTG